MYFHRSSLHRHLLAFVCFCAGLFVGSLALAGVSGIKLGGAQLELADGSDEKGAVGDIVGTYALNSSNSVAYGLAYRAGISPNRLYVSDSNDDRIYTYHVASSGLTHQWGEMINTQALDPAFLAPRGLAYGADSGTPWLFAVTSNDDDGDGVFASRLWRIDLSEKTLSADSISLDHPHFGIEGREVFGLAYAHGRVLVSYDTSAFASGSEQVTKGIMRLRVDGTKWFTTYWNLAAWGYASLAEAHLPHSGRSVSGTYGRAPSFGLAFMDLGNFEYLWGTSYNKYIYLGDGDTGRGVFVFDSPGEKNIYGLAYGGGHLWAVDRVSGGADQVHKLKTAVTSNEATEGPRTVRHLKMVTSSKANSNQSKAGVEHNFAHIHSSSVRPSQGRDASSVEVSHSGASASTYSKSYDPAGDVSARQYYRQVDYTGSVSKNDVLTSSYEATFWTSKSRHFVYPHRVNSGAPPTSKYTSDSNTIYKMSDVDAYETFFGAVEDETTSEYGASMASTSAYWRARNILEYIVENHDYGNVSDASVGHMTWHPANLKMKLSQDASTSNNKMSCSTSAFVLAGMLRYLGVSARWVGTTKWRNSYEDLDGVDHGWDANENGYLDAGEFSVDRTYHRWPEVWLGSNYGWQRFDPTPSSDGPREHSQYELMQKSAMGVGTSDLVTTVGSAYVTPLYDNENKLQRYNNAIRYDKTSKWSHKNHRWIEWSNPLSLEVQSPYFLVLGSTPTAAWTAGGNWALDPGATLSIHLQKLKYESGGYVVDGERVLLEDVVDAHHEETDLDLTGIANGIYRVEMEKNGDALTGTVGHPFMLFND
jgi:hypothetical protein